jgi:active breakpoint cluster region-related protein
MLPMKVVTDVFLLFRREKRDVPFLISACVREVERRGMCEVGIYRVSGSASDLAKLKKSFETSECFSRL